MDPRSTQKQFENIRNKIENTNLYNTRLGDVIREIDNTDPATIQHYIDRIEQEAADLLSKNELILKEPFFDALQEDLKTLFTLCKEYQLIRGINFSVNSGEEKRSGDNSPAPPLSLETKPHASSPPPDSYREDLATGIGGGALVGTFLFLIPPLTPFFLVGTILGAIAGALAADIIDALKPKVTVANKKNRKSAAPVVAVTPTPDQTTKNSSASSIQTRLKQEQQAEPRYDEIYNPFQGSDLNTYEYRSNSEKEKRAKEIYHLIEGCVIPQNENLEKIKALWDSEDETREDIALYIEGFKEIEQKEEKVKTPSTKLNFLESEYGALKRHKTGNPRRDALFTAISDPWAMTREDLENLRALHNELNSRPSLESTATNPSVHPSPRAPHR